VGGIPPSRETVDRRTVGGTTLLFRTNFDFAEQNRNRAIEQ